MSLYDKKMQDEMGFKLLKALNVEDEYTMDDFNLEFNGQETTEVNNMFKLSVKFVNESKNENPEYATNGSAGFDFRANLESPLEIPNASSGDNVRIVGTGLFFELPEGVELQVRPRSGLAAKHSVTVLNSPGTIDSDYRGEVKIILINHGPTNFRIENGDRIAQGVIANVISKNIIDLTPVKSIDNNTERSTNGFGSTGVK